MLTAIQKATRLGGIGSSDISALLGLSPWASPIDVWLAKTGRAPEIDDSRIELRMGHALEPLLAELYTERTGIELQDPVETFVSPHASWMVASPDRTSLSPRKVVELKLAYTSQGWGDEGTDDAPDVYLCQVNYQCDVMDYPEADIAAIVGRAFRVYSVRRDDELCGFMREAAERFWVDYVLPDVQPPITAHESDRKYLQSKFPRNDEVVTVATPEIDAIAQALVVAKGELENADAIASLLENQLREAIGEHAGIKGADWRAMWKRGKDKSKTDWEAVARELGVTPEIIRKHTITKPGNRPFLFRPKE